MASVDMREHDWPGSGCPECKDIAPVACGTMPDDHPSRYVHPDAPAWLLPKDRIIWSQGYLAAAPAAPVASGEAVAPIAYEHRIAEPDGQVHTLFSRVSANPWSHWLKDHREQCEYSCTPLYTASTAPAASGADAGGVRVKPLEWHIINTHGGEAVSATCMGMNWRLQTRSMRQAEIDEFKEKSQAECERLLRAALSSAATPPEPVGWIVGNGNGDRWRCWEDGMSAWTDVREKAIRYARRSDAESAHQEDIDAWRIVPFATPEPALAGDGAGVKIARAIWKFERWPEDFTEAQRDFDWRRTRGHYEECADAILAALSAPSGEGE